MIAARHFGYEPEVLYPTPASVFISVILPRSSVQGSSKLFDAIPHRQSTRSLYDGHAVSVSDLQQLETVSESEGVTALILTADKDREALLEYINTGNRQQYADPAYLAELVSWLRFNKPEALHERDGLYTACSSNPQLPRWLGRRLLRAGDSSRQSATDAANVRSSSGLIVLASGSDDIHGWIETGRMYERLALTATHLHLKTAFLNQPVEVPGVRSQLQSHLTLGSTHPQLLFRFGHAPALPRSLRRPLEEVLN